MTAETKRYEKLRVELMLKHLADEFRELNSEPTRQPNTVVIMADTYGKVVEYLIARKQELI